MPKRMGKRGPSSSSYTSTVTTIVSISLCVLGVWVLTSNSVIPTQITASSDQSESSNTIYNNVLNAFNNRRQSTTPVFEDSPGDLPDDAMKSGDPGENNLNSSSSSSAQVEHDEQKVDDTTPKEEHQIPESKQDIDKEPDKVKNEEEETSSGAVILVDQDSQASQGKESATEGQEKQETLQTQASEESHMTLNQQVKQVTEEDAQQKQTNEDDTMHAEGNAEPVQINNKEKENAEKENSEEPQITQESNQNTKNDDEAEKPKSSKESRNEETRQQGKDQDNKEETTSNNNNEIKDETPKSHTLTITQDLEMQPASQLDNPDNGDVETKHVEAETKHGTSTKATANSGESYSGIPKESKESNKAWATQVDQSHNEKERRSDAKDGSLYGYTWQLCNVTAGADFIPCLDNEKAIRKLRSRKHYEHRERHCPEEGPSCLVPIPEGYKRSIEWPGSRDKIWYKNVPHTLLAEVKGHQNWVKVTGEFLTFPGGGTQFIHGALHYIDFLQEADPKISWGKNTRVILDVGCGVASFGGFLFERDVLAMSFAPKDEHEAQVQFALERGIPAISAVMGSQRLPFPSRVFDLVHCARCRVPWHEDGGSLLLELNRVLRPGGLFVWSATPVYQKLEEDVEIWKAMSALTASMCWKVVTIKKDKLNSIGVAIYRKPNSNTCYNHRKEKQPPMCKSDDDPNAAWYVPLQSCMHRVPVDATERGSQWPAQWPQRLQTPPNWLNKSQMGIYGKPAPDDFVTDFHHWTQVVNNLYINGLGISWSNVRNIMDMRAVYGGFAAALKDMKVWVMNVVNVDSADTLPIIYERGLFGMYHDWCESFSTYPRTYDLLHADHLFSRIKKRCKIVPLMAEVDRIVRPGGKLIVRDEASTVGEVENLLKSLHWEVRLTFSKDKEGILSAQKSDWRPDSYEAASS